MSIKNKDGIDVQGNKAIAEEAVTYFRELFSTSNHPQLTEMLSNIDCVVTEEMNQNLTRELTDDEIKKVFSLLVLIRH